MLSLDQLMIPYAIDAQTVFEYAREFGHLYSFDVSPPIVPYGKRAEIELWALVHDETTLLPPIGTVVVFTLPDHTHLDLCVNELLDDERAKQFLARLPFTPRGALLELAVYLRHVLGVPAPNGGVNIQNSTVTVMGDWVVHDKIEIKTLRDSTAPPPVP